MRKLSAGILALLVTCGVTACGYKDGVENHDSRAFLYFTGNTKQAEVLVDDVPLGIGEHVDTNDRFQIQPGQHLVEVRRHGQSIVRRQIYVTEGAAKEIQVPNQ